jgi:hypothetical protein
MPTPLEAVSRSAPSTILSTISRGKRPRHIFALFYGTDGVGKTTVCSRAPNPIFIGAEKGTEQLDVARFPQTESIGELLSQVRALYTEKHEFDSVVLDSLDWVEPLIWKSVCDEGKVDTIEQYAGGYGKGYVRALDLWRTLIRELSVLNERMHVLLIGHAQIKSFQDPELPTAYDRYQLKINDKAAALVREAADAVLFARFETELVKTNGKTRAYGEGNRIMYTESRPGWDAKNRFNLPFVLPLDWKVFGDAIRAFYGLSGKGNGSAKGKVVPEEKPAQDDQERPPVAYAGGNVPSDDANANSALCGQSAQPDPSPAISSKNLLQKVKLRLGGSQISESEFLDVLRFSRIVEAQNLTALDQVPAKFLTMALEGWSTVAEIAHELRARNKEVK